MENDTFRKEDLLQNEFYQKFLVEDFDVKKHASQVLQASVVSEQLSKLSEGLSLLDKTIHNQVSEHYEDLLKHASGIETLEYVTSMMQAHIQGFSASIERLKARISEPHDKLQTQTLMMSRLQASCELLRRIIRIIGLSKRLEGYLQAGSEEITKSTQTLYDRPKELGRSYRILRSLRPLLFQTVDHLSQSTVVGDVIAYSLVLHFLFAHAPSELKSPHQGAGWSVVSYSKWLDEHPSAKRSGCR